MTIGEWAILGAILFLTWKPEIREQFRHTRRRILKYLRGRNKNGA